MGRTTAATAIRVTPAHLTIPALLSASGGVTSQFLDWMQLGSYQQVWGWEKHPTLIASQTRTAGLRQRQIMIFSSKPQPAFGFDGVCFAGKRAAPPCSWTTTPGELICAARKNGYGQR